MTVAELISKLQGLDQEAVVVGHPDGIIALLEDVDVEAGWFCPSLIHSGGDDFWSDTERCGSPSGVYEPRPQDVRAVRLRCEG